MFKRKRIILTLIALCGILAKQTLIADGHWIDINTKKVISLAAVGTIAVGVYKYGPQLYHDLQDRINTKINEEVVDSLILLLTPNYVINKSNEQERELRFQKKARLKSIYERITKRLDAVVKSEEKSVSQAHKKQLKENLNRAKVILDTANFIDKGISFFTNTKVTFDQKEPSYIDQFIEAQICSSIIFSAKPISECTEEEKTRKAQGKQKLKQIIARKISQFGETWLLQEKILSILCE